MKKMIAYNSKTLPFLFLVPLILVIICGYFAVSELNDYKILASIFFGVVSLVLFSAFIYTFTNHKIAFEINYDELIIYKRKKIFVIKISTITKVKIGKNNIGFDCVVYYNDDKKIGMHFLVKNFVKTNKQFIQTVKDMNIKTEFYSVGHNH